MYHGNVINVSDGKIGTFGRLTCYYCTLRPDNYVYAQHGGPPLVKTFEIDVDNVACGYSVINTTVVSYHLAP